MLSKKDRKAEEEQNETAFNPDPMTPADAAAVGAPGINSAAPAPTSTDAPATATVTTTTVPARPAVDVTQTQAKQNPPKFSFDVEPSFTGRIQFHTNGEEAATVTTIGRVLRGEVIDVSNRQKLANGLVENGSFAHVANDTPLGQPEEFKAKPVARTAADSATDAKKK